MTKNKAFFWSLYAVLLFWGAVTESVYAQQLINPLKSKYSTVSGFVEAILDIVVQIGIPVVAIFIIYSGFLFVKARGKDEELQTAKKTFLWTLVGAGILLGASVLAQVIGGTLAELRR